MNIEDFKKRIRCNHLAIFDILREIKNINWNFLTLYRFENLKYLWDISRFEVLKPNEPEYSVENCIATEKKTDPYCITRDYIEINALYGIFKTLPCVKYYNTERYKTCFQRIAGSAVFNKHGYPIAEEMSPVLLDMLTVHIGCSNTRGIYIIPEKNEIIDENPSQEDRVLNFFEMLACAGVANMSILVWTFLIFDQKIIDQDVRKCFYYLIFNLEGASDNQIETFDKLHNNFRLDDINNLERLKDLRREDDEDLILDRAYPPYVNLDFYLSLFDGDLSQFYFTTPLESVSMMITKIKRRNVPEKLEDLIRVSNTQTITKFEKDGLTVLTMQYPYRIRLYTTLFDPSLPNEFNINELDINTISLPIVKKKILNIFLKQNIVLNDDLKLIENIQQFQNIEETFIQFYKNLYPHKKHGLSALENLLTESRDCSTIKRGGVSGIFNLIGKRYNTR